MKVIGRGVIDGFGRSHADVRSQIISWVCEVEEAQWHGPMDVKRRFPQASILSGNRVIFNLKGNKYRLEAKISYAAKVVLVRQMGTHAEYAKWIL
jgi:mRNA interferase HigB